MPKTLINMEMKRLDLKTSVEMRPPRRANRKVSTYGHLVGKREFAFHLPPSGTELVGDEEVWEVLLLEGKPVPEHPLAFEFGDMLLHQPTFLGQETHGKPVCCVWDVNTGDVYYRGPQGPPLDLERKKQLEIQKMEARQKENQAAEEKRHKITELQAKLRAEVEMRAKLDAEAKLKLQAEDEQGQELLAKARAEIEERILATGSLPVLASVAPAVKQNSARVVSENEEEDLNEVSPFSHTACIMHLRVPVSAQDKVK